MKSASHVNKLNNEQFVKIYMKCSNRTIGYANKMGHLVQKSCSLYANNKNTGQIAHQRVFINDIVRYCLERIK